MLEKLKLSKPLIKSMMEAGYREAREIQAKVMSRIIGGQDVIAVAPAGSGKTTTYVLGVLMRLKQGDEAPRALVLVPNQQKVLDVSEQFNLLNKNKTIRILGLHAAMPIEEQMDELADGADIVVSTPDQARAVYLKLGLNLNKIMMFVVDDASLMLKQSLQVPLKELARSTPKCQRLIFTETIDHKLSQMVESFMNFPALVEVEEEISQGNKMEAYPQLGYQVPNLKTKINLLNLLLQDENQFSKVAVFVNSRLTAHKLYKSLLPVLAAKAAVLKPLSFELKGFDSIEDFNAQSEIRVLIIATEGSPAADIQDFPVIIHFELPEVKEVLLNRMMQSGAKQSNGIIFSSKAEQGSLEKAEQLIGQKIPVADLPANLLIDRTENGNSF